jgi:hypothetical protein
MVKPSEEYPQKSARNRRNYLERKWRKQYGPNPATDELDEELESVPTTRTETLTSRW